MSDTDEYETCEMSGEAEVDQSGDVEMAQPENDQANQPNGDDEEAMRETGDAKTDDEEKTKADEKLHSDTKPSTTGRRRKRPIDYDRIPDLISNNVQRQRNEVWKKTVMMGPLQWEDVIDPCVTTFVKDCCTLSIIHRQKTDSSTDCHLELRFVNQGDAANCADRLERPIRVDTGHTIRRRTRMPLESQLQEWDQMMFSRMYMGNRVFLFVDNVPPTAAKEDVFATFPSCSYITFTLRPDLLTGYSVLEYRSEEDIEDDLYDAPKMLHGNVLTTFQLTRSTQFHDRGRPVAQRHREEFDMNDRSYQGGRGGRSSGGGRYNRSPQSGYGQMNDRQSLNDLESMLLQEIGRKVMMGGSGSLMGGMSQGRRYQSGGRRW